MGKKEMSDIPRIFISATGQNAGKTTFSLGLIAALLKKFKRIGFIKPIGQRYLMEQGFQVDEDSVLIEKLFKTSPDLSIKDTSPVAVERGFTEKYIEGKSKGDYAKQIKDSFERVSLGKDLVIIEGTGHAGVGSVFDLSNATVAKLLGAKVVLLAPGGVGRPIDEVMLNKPLFDQEKVELAGVVVNKVLTHKYNKIKKYVKKGFKNKNMDVLGVMPYQRRLDLPTIREIQEEMKLEAVSGEEMLDNHVDKILIGAMEVEDAVKYLVEHSLVITPSDRSDIIRAMIDIKKIEFRKPYSISGMVLTGGKYPEADILESLRKQKIPVLMFDGDTYAITMMINKMNVKIKPTDKFKINIVIKMVERYVDIDSIIKKINE